MCIGRANPVSNSPGLEKDRRVGRGEAEGSLEAPRVPARGPTIATRIGRWLDGDPLAFSPRPLEPREWERVRVAQLAAVRRGSAAPLAAAAVCAAALPIGLWDTPARAPLVLWALLTGAAPATFRALRRRVGAAQADAALADVSEFRLATIQAIVVGALWACGFAFAEAHADAGQRTLIATLAMGVMSGGALQLALAPPMACGFITPLALFCVVAAVLTPDATALPVLAVQLVNAGFLAFQAHFQSTELARRTIAHFADQAAARLDPLTGLGNRLAFGERLAAAFERLRDVGEKFALLCFDVDRLPSVDDAFGGVAGDEMILRAARALRLARREHDFVARIGVDEFALIAPQTPSREAAEARARDIVAEVRRPSASARRDGACSVSVGVALAPDHGEDGDRLVRAAGAALYKAKHGARGAIAFVGDWESGEARERRELQTALRLALRNGEMRLDFQPLVDAASGATKGFEALLRWRRPGFGDMPASLFVPRGRAMRLHRGDRRLGASRGDAHRRVLAEAIAGRRQRLRRAIEIAVARGGHPRNRRNARVRSAPPRAGDHRILVHRRLRGGRREPERLASPRRRHRARRFRRRLFLDDLDRAPAARPHQDRSRLRHRRPGQPAMRGGDPLGGEARQGTRPRADRRGRRNLRTVRSVALGRMRRGAGLPLQPALARRRSRPGVRALREPLAAREGSLRDVFVLLVRQGGKIRAPRRRRVKGERSRDRAPDRTRPLRLKTRPASCGSAFLSIARTACAVAPSAARARAPADGRRDRRARRRRNGAGLCRALATSNPLGRRREP
jgi:diguanylate cyclase (GGDEF)-like protein